MPHAKFEMPGVNVGELAPSAVVLASMLRVLITVVPITAAMLTSNTATSLAGSASRSTSDFVDPFATSGICVGTPAFCAAKQGLVVVNFDLGSSTLTMAAQLRLDELCTELTSARLQNSNVSVDGHTDAIGTETNNLALSADRADAVADYLAERGVALSRISRVGKGEKHLISGPMDPINRRADIRYQP